MKKLLQYKKAGVFLLFVFESTYISAQASVKNEPGMWDWALDNIFLILGIAAFIGGLNAIINLSAGLLELQKLRTLKEMGVDVDAILEEQKVSKLQKIYKWLIGLKPVAEESELDMGHSYDGIRELDNSLPPWWLYLFYGSIAFAVIYMYKYHFSDTEWSSLQEYEVAMAKAEDQRILYLDKMANAVNEKTVTLLTDDESLEVGKTIYINKCAVCHGNFGEGLVGPNFADEYWVHGGSIKDLFTVIKYGVPEKGMISWKKELKPASMQKVASYILTLEGTSPPNQKEKEGTLYDRSKEADGESKSE